jgi:hypothetical protein
MSAPPPSDQRRAPLALWRVASALLNTLFALFGGPDKLAAKHTLTAAAYKLTADWLRTAETLMRRLVFIEASAYAPPAPSRRAPGKTALRTRKLMSFDADKPERWRVSFRAITPDRQHLRQHGSTDLTRPDGAACAARGSPASRRFCSAWPLAERFEALIRVHNDPAAYAGRLARRLHVAPKLIALVLRASDTFARRIDEGVDAQIEMLCARAALSFNSS